VIDGDGDLGRAGVNRTIRQNLRSEANGGPRSRGLVTYARDARDRGSRMISKPRKTIADSLVERLTRGQDHHCQRWGLHLPEAGESLKDVRPLVVLLGLPTFGLALAISVVTTYGPVVPDPARHSTTTVGAVIGAEGAFALVVPLAAGALSDRLPASALGRRLPFVLAGAPLIVAGSRCSRSARRSRSRTSQCSRSSSATTSTTRPTAPSTRICCRERSTRAQAGQAIARGAGSAPRCSWAVCSSASGGRSSS
jgi:hypothetical protein